MVIKERVLVTGGEGFIGSHLIDELVKNYEVYSFDNSLPGFGNKYINPLAHQITGDIRKIEDIEFAIKNIHYVIHLAALSHVSTCLNDPKLAFDVNVGGTINLLDACRKLGTVKKIIVAASDHIYGRNPKLPVNELHPFKALTQWDVYGKTKAIQAIISDMYWQLYGMSVVVTASGNVYSSRQSKPNIIPNFIDAALHDKDLMIHGTGAQTRDLYHIDDLVQGYIKCLETSNIEGELFNFGSGTEISVNQIAFEILELIPNSKSKIIHTKDTQYNAMERMQLDILKSKKILNWYPKIKLEDGLKKTIEEWRLKL